MRNGVILLAFTLLISCGSVDNTSSAQSLAEPYPLYFVSQTIRGNMVPIVEYMVTEGVLANGEQVGNPACSDGLFLLDTIQTDTGQLALKVLLRNAEHSLSLSKLLPADVQEGTRIQVQVRNPSKNDQPACGVPGCECEKFTELNLYLEEYSFSDSLNEQENPLPYPWDL